MKRSLFGTVLFCSALAAHAQFGAGAQVNWSKYFQGGPSFTGLGINASLVVADDYPLRLSVNFGLPSTTSYTTEAYAFSSATDPRSVSVNYDEKISLINVWLDAQKFFGDGDYEDGGAYGLLGLGYTSASVKYSVGSYNESLYNAVVGEDSHVGQLGIRAALGYDKGFDFGNLFAEAGLNLSANQQNGQEVEVNLPSFLFVNVGIRHWFE